MVLLVFWFGIHLGLLGMARSLYRVLLPGVPDVGVISVPKLYAFLSSSHDVAWGNSGLLVLIICSASYFLPPFAAGLGGGLHHRGSQAGYLCLLILATAWISIWQDRQIHFVVSDYTFSAAFIISIGSMAPIFVTVALGFLIGQACSVACLRRSKN